MSRTSQSNYDPSEAELKQKYPAFEGYFIEYNIDARTKAHVVKVYEEKHNRRGEGDTKDDAYKDLYEKVSNKDPLQGSSYRQEVHNYVEKKGGYLKEDVDDQGKAAVSVRYLVKEVKGSSRSSAFRAALGN